MKKIVLVVLVLIIMGGCCKRIAPDGTVSTNPANCFQAAQDIICNPPAAVVTTVQIVSPMIASALNLMIPGTAEFVNATNAFAACQAIRRSSCVVMTDLNALITWINNFNAAQVGAKALAPVNPQPLLDWQMRARK